MWISINMGSRVDRLSNISGNQNQFYNLIGSLSRISEQYILTPLIMFGVVFYSICGIPLVILRWDSS